MSIISQKTIDKVKRTKNKEGEHFFTVSYDLPSESREFSDKDEEKAEEIRKKLKRKRLDIHKRAKLYGVMLGQSVYVIRTGKALNFIDLIENKYEDSEFEDDVKVNIVGEVYKDVVLNLLDEYLDDNTHEMREKLEKIQAKISGADDDELSSMKSKLYYLKEDVDVMENRVDDLKELDRDKSAEYNNRVRALKEKREELLEEVKNK